MKSGFLSVAAALLAAASVSHTALPLAGLQGRPGPHIEKKYSFRVRTVLRPRCSREEVLAEVKKWQEPR